MKLLALLPVYRPKEYPGPIGGGEISNRLLLSELAGAHDVVVVAMDAGGMWGTRSDGVLIYDVSSLRAIRPLRKTLRFLRYPYWAKRLADQLCPDIVIASTSAVPIASKISERKRIPSGAFMRAYENFAAEPKVRKGFEAAKEFLKSQVLGQQRGESISRLKFLIANSDYMARRCETEFMHSCVHVVYPPISMSQRAFQPRRPVRTVVMVGASEKKGAEIFREIARKLDCLEFKLIGDPTVPPNASVTEGNFTRCGWTVDQSVFLDEADLVLVPSLWEEPFGRIAVEALRSGKLVLVSGAGGLPEAVSNSEMLIVRSTDSDDWVNRIEEVCAAPEQYRAECEKVAVCSQRFTVTEQAAALEQALLENLAT